MSSFASTRWKKNKDKKAGLVDERDADNNASSSLKSARASNNAEQQDFMTKEVECLDLSVIDIIEEEAQDNNSLNDSHNSLEEKSLIASKFSLPHEHEEEERGGVQAKYPNLNNASPDSVGSLLTSDTLCYSTDGNDYQHTSSASNSCYVSRPVVQSTELEPRPEKSFPTFAAAERGR